MSEDKNKHIDDFFKKKFEDFEATPNDALWGRIAQNLDEEVSEDMVPIDAPFQEKLTDYTSKPDSSIWIAIKKKLDALDKKEKQDKVIPIWWWRSGGIAASFLILLGLYFFYTNNTSSPTTVVEEDYNELLVDSLNIIKDHKAPILNQNNIVTQQEEGNNRTDQGLDNNSLRQPSVATTDAVTTNNPNHSQSNDVEEGVTTRKAHPEHTTKNTPANKLIENQLINTPDQVAAIKNDNNTVTEPENFKNQNSVSTPTPVTPNNNTALELAETSPKNPNTDTNKKTQEGKKSIYDAIREQEQLDELFAEMTSESKQWKVAPTVAPLLYNNSGDGSHIDAQFDNNSKSYDAALSYGIQVAYAINDKLEIRSGAHSVSVASNTNDLQFTITPNAQTIDNIDYQSTSAKLVELSSEGENNNIAARTTNTTNVWRDASLHQRLDYVEIPVELKYNVVNKKLGLNVIGGVSTLLLTENKVTMVAEQDNFATELGAANNINSTSFSGNVGLGIDYQISDNFKVNLEPMLKYQVSTFSDNTNLNPVYMGIYSGVQFIIPNGKKKRAMNDFVTVERE